MTDLNKVVLIGRLTRDPEIKVVGNDTKIADFSIAVNYTVYKKDAENVEEVNFINCVAFSGLAGVIEKYAKKGGQVCVSGRLKQERWEDTDGKARQTVKIIADSLQLLGSKSSGDSVNPDGDIPF